MPGQVAAQTKFFGLQIEPQEIAERQSLRGVAPQHVELVSKDKDLGFQRSPNRNSPIKTHQINLQRSLIDRTINRFASVSQLFGIAVGTTLGCECGQGL